MITRYITRSLSVPTATVPGMVNNSGDSHDGIETAPPTSPDRKKGDILATSITDALQILDEKTDEPSTEARLQLDVLLAIYYELRHGHDQAAAESERLAAHTEALHQHADEMDNVKGALLEHADAMSRYRNRDR